LELILTSFLRIHLEAVAVAEVEVAAVAVRPKSVAQMLRRKTIYRPPLLLLRRHPFLPCSFGFRGVVDFHPM
jgi:hypothetical protein